MDPNTVPSFLTRSVSGLSYEGKWFSGRLESILFGESTTIMIKSTAEFRAFNSSEVFTYEQNGQETGYGGGLRVQHQRKPIRKGQL